MLKCVVSYDRGSYDPDHKVESKIMIRVLLSVRHKSVKCVLNINQDIIKESLRPVYVYASITRKICNFF